MTRRLPTSFFERPIHELARDFLGRHLVRRVAKDDSGESTLAARIVEVEVYTGGGDPASHAKEDAPTDRTRPMFARPGTLYVYRIYGMWDCLNISAEAPGEAAAILIRAAEPLAGIEFMAEQRDVKAPDQPAQQADAPPRDAWSTSDLWPLLSGPGKLCQAMAITRDQDGGHVDESPVWLAPGDRPADQPPTDIAVEKTPRIGLNRETVGDAVDWPWRYVDSESSFLSR